MLRRDSRFHYLYGYEKGIQLALRLGIHTGLVVVGAMGGAGRQEQLALGEVPNVCSRIQGLAEPDTLFISAATYQLESLRKQSLYKRRP